MTDVMKEIHYENETEESEEIPESEWVFSQETIDALAELEAVYQEIWDGLVLKGYTILDGVIIPPHNKTKEDHGTKDSPHTN